MVQREYEGSFQTLSQPMPSQGNRTNHLTEAWLSASTKPRLRHCPNQHPPQENAETIWGRHGRVRSQSLARYTFQTNVTLQEHAKTLEGGMVECEHKAPLETESQPTTSPGARASHSRTVWLSASTKPRLRHCPNQRPHQEFAQDVRGRKG